jgi:hypothetical protein
MRTAVHQTIKNLQQRMPVIHLQKEELTWRGSSGTSYFKWNNLINV